MRLIYNQLIIVLVLLNIGFAARAQNSVAIGTPTPDPAAVLLLVGNGSQGLVLPVANNIATMPLKAGMIVYSGGKVYFCDGATWSTIGGAGSGSTYTLSYDATTKTISLISGASGTPSVTISTTALTGDLGGTLGAPTVVGVQGKGITLPANSGYLYYDVTQAKWVFQNPSNSLPTPGANQILTSNSSSAPTWSSTISGNAISSGTIGGSTAINTTGTATVAGLTVSGATTSLNNKTYTWPNNPTLTAGTFLQTDASGNLSWTTPSGGLPTPGANQILTSNNSSVATWSSTISGNAITSGTIAGTTAINSTGAITTTGALSTGTSTKFGTVAYTWPGAQGTNGTVLTNNGSGTLSWAAPLVSGTASGDLTGAYPNPTIANTATTGNNIISSVNSASTSIIGARVNPSFGNQNITTTAGINAGSSNQFSIDATGNITKVNNVATNFPSAQGSAGTVLTNDGTGKLNWLTPTITPPVQVPFNTDVFEYNGNSTLRLTINNTLGQYELGKLGSPGTAIFSTNWSTGDTYIAGKLGVGVAPASMLDVSGDVHLAQLAAPPAATADKLYNVGGSLFWNGTNLSSGGGSGWALTGNAGTVDATNFIGTSDLKPFNIRVNNISSGRIDPTLLNTFFGYQSGSISTTGSNNTGLGYLSLNANVSGNDNVAIGFGSMKSNKDGGGNVAIGRGSLFSISLANGGTSYGSYNTAVGYQALYQTNPTATTNGYHNTAIGFNAGQANTTGTSNTFVGTAADASIGNLSNATAIGANAVVSASNSLVLGGIGANAVNVGIGTSAPGARLDVQGGDINTSGEVNRTSTGAANMVPIAYGTIDSNGAIKSGSGNFTVVSFSNGGSGSTYTISITGETYTSTGYITTVTPNLSSGGGCSSNPPLAYTFDSSPNLGVFVFSLSGGSTSTPCGMWSGIHFVVYKP